MKITDKELQNIKDRARAEGINEGYDKGFNRGFELGEFVGASKRENYWLTRIEEEYQKFTKFLEGVVIFKPQTKMDKEIEEIWEGKNE